MAEIILTVSRVLNHYFASMDASSSTEMKVLVPWAVTEVCGWHLGELVHGCFLSYHSSVLDVILCNRLQELLLKLPLFADNLSLPLPPCNKTPTTLLYLLYFLNDLVAIWFLQLDKIHLTNNALPSLNTQCPMETANNRLIFFLSFS